MQTAPPREAEKRGHKGGTNSDRDDECSEAFYVTTEEDVEVDSVTPKRMESLRDIADRYAGSGAASK